MIEVYAWMILLGNKELEEIPSEIVDEVQRAVIKLTSQIQNGNV